MKAARPLAEGKAATPTLLLLSCRLLVGSGTVADKRAAVADFLSGLRALAREFQGALVFTNGVKYSEVEGVNTPMVSGGGSASRLPGLHHVHVWLAASGSAKHTALGPTALLPEPRPVAAAAAGQGRCRWALPLPQPVQQQGEAAEGAPAAPAAIPALPMLH